jgi:hypothetical protein
MDPEEVERGFVDAGWEVPGPARYPIVGNADDLSIVAHEQYAKSDDPTFELVDGRRMLSYWVRVIITLLSAKAKVLRVDPTRLELVTSAMRRQHEEFVSIRLRSKTAANKHILPKLMSPVCAIVRLGWCQIGVNRNVLEAGARSGRSSFRGSARASKELFVA